MATLKRFETNERDSLLMAGVMQSIKSNLGSIPVNLDAKFTSPTLWGSTTCIAEELIDVGLYVWALQAEFTDFKSFVSESFEEQVVAAAKRSPDRVVDVLTLLMDNVKEMAPDLAGMKSSVSTLLKDREDYQRLIGSKKYRASDERKTPDEVDELRRMLDGSSMNQAYVDPSRKVEFSFRGEPASAVTAEKLAFMEDNFKVIFAELEALKMSGEKFDVSDKIDSFFAEVKALKTVGDGSAIKIANLGFKSIRDVSKWTSENFKGSRYGLIMDPLLLLDRICGETAADKTLKAIQLRINLKLTTGGEGSVIESLSNAWHRLFHSGAPTMTYARNVSRLNKLQKHSDWEASGGGGVREHIIAQMNNLHLSRH